jgi:hypothetical protein
MYTDVSEETTASSFRVEDYAKKETRTQQSFGCSLLFVWFAPLS